MLAWINHLYYSLLYLLIIKRNSICMSYDKTPSAGIFGCDPQFVGFIGSSFNEYRDISYISSRICICMREVFVRCMVFFKWTRRELFHIYKRSQSMQYIHQKVYATVCVETYIALLICTARIRPIFSSVYITIKGHNARVCVCDVCARTRDHIVFVYFCPFAALLCV